MRFCWPSFFLTHKHGTLFSSTSQIQYVAGLQISVCIHTYQVGNTFLKSLSITIKGTLIGNYLQTQRSSNYHKCTNSVSLSCAETLRSFSQYTTRTTTFSTTTGLHPVWKPRGTSTIYWFPDHRNPGERHSTQAWSSCLWVPARPLWRWWHAARILF